MVIFRYLSSLALALICLMTIYPAHAERNALIFYPSYGDARHTVIEGRVVKMRRAREAATDDGWWRNARRNAGLMINDERRGVAVQLSVDGRDFQTVTDREGYFRVPVADLALPAGWHRFSGEQGTASAHGDLLIVPQANTIGVISDLDDTLLISQVTSKRKLLSNTFLKNPLQREAVEGAARLIAAIAARNPHPEAAPVIYLSASPRQLYANITHFLTHNHFPLGVLLTKRVTNDRTSDPLINQVAYKTRKIEEVLERLPQVRFVLLGDDGERDPEIYHAIRERYPDRIEQILIRRVHPNPARPTYPDQVDLSQAIAQLPPETIAKK